MSSLKYSERSCNQVKFQRALEGDRGCRRHLSERVLKASIHTICLSLSFFSFLTMFSVVPLQEGRSSSGLPSRSCHELDSEHWVLIRSFSFSLLLIVCWFVFLLSVYFVFFFCFNIAATSILFLVFQVLNSMYSCLFGLVCYLVVCGLFLFVCICVFFSLTYNSG